ncbi:MAG TPA: peptidase M61 [Flavobacterium sp.]|jgi:predicted metalloprotease with PDZ domain
MRKLVLASVVAASLWSFNVSAQSKSAQSVQVSIDLNSVKNDKVLVTVTPSKTTSDRVTYHIPKIIPGTYAEDDYGKFVEDFKAYDAKGKLLIVTRPDDNSWEIANATGLSKVTYSVNDTYDVEETHDIFSPAGTNILDGKNFMLNMHGFVGYFSDKQAAPYNVSVSHPATLWGATSMVDSDPSTTKDVFTTSRYAELVDHPVMYSKPDYTTFMVDGMEILIAVYSPNGVYDAKSITPDMEIMMRAQKKFLGTINSTKKYAVLLYLSDMKPTDAQGFGALEHNTSTTVSLPEIMPKDQLIQTMVDVVSHEFFHIVTPLSVHSKEIHNFDFNKPKMSEHLWMYEGITEYFANLFQVNQGLITEEEFYERMAKKISNASNMNDTMSFTTMSSNVLVEPYKAQYLNVYEKGALIGMCLDIIIREKSSGQRGVLDLMKQLTAIYGPERPFNDNELFAKIVELTYPEVGDFLRTYVSGTTPIPYQTYFAKVGVTKAQKKAPEESVFLNGQTPYVTIKPGTKEIMIIPGSQLNDFMTSLGMKSGDVITAVNGTAYNLDNIYDLIMGSMGWKEKDDITVTISRDGKEQVLKGKVKLTYKDVEGLQATDASKDKLKQAWLKA